MENERIKELLLEPGLVSPQDRFLIQEQIERFPYFQPLRLLLLKSFKDEVDHPVYKQALGLAAIYTSNREVLYDFVNDKLKYPKADKDEPETTQTTEEDSPMEVSVENEVKKEIQNQETNIAESIVEEAFEEEASNISKDIIFQPREEKIEESLEENIEADEETSGVRLEEKQSLSFWLTGSKAEPSERSKKIKQIKKFITEQPKMPPPVVGENPSPKVEEKTFSIATETLAKIYADQKKYSKAIETYKSLSLKYPEKSSFFADQINELEKKKSDGNI